MKTFLPLPTQTPGISSVSSECRGHLPASGSACGACPWSERTQWGPESEVTGATQPAY